MKKLALVLSGGAAKGYAHIGVLKVLENHNIRPDLIVGTSMGALVGGMYASGKTIEEMENLATTFNGLGNFSLISTIFRGYLLNIDKVKKIIDAQFGDKLQQECEINFVAMATNIKTGEPTCLKNGLMRDNVRASISIPGIFPIVKIDRNYYVDGGITNNLAEDVARELMPDAVIISVDVIGDYSKQVESLKLKTLKNVLNASTIMTQKIVNLKAKNYSDLKITIPQPTISQMDFNKEKAEQSIKKGAYFTSRNINKIKELLNM